MSAHSPNCAACASPESASLIDFGTLPKSGVFLADAADAFPVTRLAYRFCTHCACVTREFAVQQDSVDYTEVARDTSRQFPAYAQAIIKRLVDSSQDGLLIEIGSNDGTFMSHLRAAGVEQMLGVEPSRSLAETARGKGHQIENVPLTIEEAQRLRTQFGMASTIVCRHTLEHVPDPASFLEAMRHLLAYDGTLFVEVPSVVPIIDHRLQGYELWDEHLTYFSETNLTLILARVGLSVVSMQSLPHCGSENILCWARPAATVQATEVLEPSESEVEACFSFESRWTQYREELLTESRKWAKPVYAMGASHPQTNFLHFSGLIFRVSGLFDDDPNKINKFVPAERSVPVINSVVLRDSTAGTVLLTGFGYPDWMQRVVTLLAGKSLQIVYPFEIGNSGTESKS
jgi:2-polyprenyl-3-methyl-5-hydroxy-6-metoxy-1,4-benzoquinol methylase